MLPQFNTMLANEASEPICAIEPESSVIARAKSGDADAISALYERYAPQIQRYIASRLSDPFRPKMFARMCSSRCWRV